MRQVLMIAVLLVGCSEQQEQEKPVSKPATVETATKVQEQPAKAEETSNSTWNEWQYKLLKKLNVESLDWFSELNASDDWVVFNWEMPSPEWKFLRRDQREQALLGIDGGLRLYKRNDIRIVEVVYDAGKVKSRWQQKERLGEWVSHGPNVFVGQDGSLEVGFKIDGEWEGELKRYDSDGKLTTVTVYKAGVPTE